MKTLTLSALFLAVMMFIGVSSLNASDMKCGAGKCGSSMKTEAEMPAKKDNDKKAEMPAKKCNGQKAEMPAKKCNGKKADMPESK